MWRYIDDGDTDHGHDQDQGPDPERDIEARSVEFGEKSENENGIGRGREKGEVKTISTSMWRLDWLENGILRFHPQNIITATIIIITATEQSRSNHLSSLHN